MPEVEYVTTMRLPPERVWEFVRDMNNWAPFLTGYQHHEVKSETDSIWTLKGDVGVLSRTVQLHAHVTEWNGPERVSFTLTGLNEVVEGGGWAIEAVTTPGHTANHMSFALKDRNILFAGDHVMGWATSIVAPPDGAMSDYMASLDKLARRGENLYFSGHGPAIADAKRFVNYYILHRKAREASILHRLGKGAADIPSIVRAIYIGIDPRLTGAAGLSVLAHMEDLVARGFVETDGAPAIDGIYRLGA